MESQTFDFKLEIGQEIKEIPLLLELIKQRITEQKQQRPFNVPYIRFLEKEYQKHSLDLLHYKDRLDKLDGCFK